MKKVEQIIMVWERFFLTAGNIVFFAVFCILLTTDDRVHRSAANWQLFLINLLILAVLCAGSLLTWRRGKPLWKHPAVALLGIYLLLFVLQCILVNATYFYTGWDVDLMKWRIEGLLDGYSLQELGGDSYLSIHSNNLLIFYVQYLAARTGKLLSLAVPYNLCFYVSCFCVAASCYFGSLMVRKMTQNGMIRCMYGLTSTVFILFCPWIGIPYSDTYGMLFATLGLWAVYCLEKPVFKWPVLAFSALLGYHMKPTCIFPLFAALILYLPEGMMEFRKRKRELGILLLSCLVFFGAGQGALLLAQHQLAFRMDAEQRFPPNHFMMMGLNVATKGGFSPEDHEFSVSIPDYEERERQIWEVIGERWNRMTAAQRGEHYLVKLIYIMNNGTFSWGDEGIFFDTVPEHDNPLHDIYSEIFYPEGKYFALYCEFAQVIWMQILLGIVFLFLDLRRETYRKALLMIVLCGLLVFLMLFEARARYLILYSPAFLILSLHGYEGLFSRIYGKVKKTKPTQ